MSWVTWKRVVDVVLRGLSALILVGAAYPKLLAAPESVHMFSDLGMEPHGRVLIGVLEGLAALSLVSPAPAPGAFVGIGIMLGAFIAHTTRLGMAGALAVPFGLMWVVLLGCLWVFVRHRSDLPIIGNTLGDAD